MIVRIWRGRASAAGADGYADHFRRRVLPELQAIDGFLGAALLRGDEAGEVTVLVLTRWRSLDTIRAFAGEDVARAVVEPEAAAVLTGFDDRVHHYEVVEELTGGR